MKLRKPLSIRDLEAEAGLLSNFDGDFAAEMNAYDGYGDDLVDFEGGRTSFDELNLSNERIYQCTITNANLTDENFYIAGGLSIDKVDVIGSAVDGLVVADGTFTSIAGNNLTMAGHDFDWALFYNWFTRNPTRVVGLKVASNVATQMETAIQIDRESPFKTLQNRFIRLSTYQNENTYQDKQVTIPEKFNLDDQAKVRFTVKASSSMTITFYCGAVLNPGKALHKKALKAMNFKERRNGYAALAAKNASVGALQIGGAAPRYAIGSQV